MNREILYISLPFTLHQRFAPFFFSFPTLMRQHIGYSIKQDQACSNQKKKSIFNNAKEIDQILTSCNSRSISTGCDVDVSPKLKLLSGIDALAMARNRARAFSLPKHNWKISKNRPRKTARYYLLKHTVQALHLRRLWEGHSVNTILGRNKQGWNDSLPPVMKKIRKPEGINPETCEKVLRSDKTVLKNYKKKNYRDYE